MDITEKVLQFKQDFDEVYAAGKAAGGGGSGDTDFCKYADEITFKSFNDFGSSTVELTLNNLTSLYNFIRTDTQTEYTNTTVEEFILNSTGIITRADYAFACLNATQNRYLKKITLNADWSNATTVRSSFAYCSGLEVIDGTPLNFASATGANALATTFTMCSSLIEVRFVENSIPQSLSLNNSSTLSSASIQSIIDGLMDLTGSTAQTLDFHSNVVDKLTDDQFTQIANKNWDVT